LNIAIKIKDQAIASAMIAHIGTVYRKQGQPQQALDQYWQALSVAREISDRAQQGSILNLIGLAYDSLGQYQPALQQYQQALAIVQDIDERSEERNILNNIGLTFDHQSQPELAIAFLKASVNVSQDIRSNNRSLSQELQKSYTKTVSDSYRTLARLLLDQGRLLEAEQVLELLKQEEIKEYTRATVDRTGAIEQTEIEKLIIEKYGSLTRLGQEITNCQNQSRPCDELQNQLNQLTEEYNQAVLTIESSHNSQTLDDAAIASNNVLSIGSKLITAHSIATSAIFQCLPYLTVINTSSKTTPFPLSLLLELQILIPHLLIRILTLPSPSDFLKLCLQDLPLSTRFLWNSTKLSETNKPLIRTVAFTLG
jgi:tetratricopeptide (TPR) repeat protein